MPSYLDDADDVLEPPGGLGPFRDPQVTITAPESGKVTVVVTEVASDDDDGGDGRFDYRLEIAPEPLDIALDAELIGQAPEIGAPFFG